MRPEFELICLNKKTGLHVTQTRMLNVTISKFKIFKMQTTHIYFLIKHFKQKKHKSKKEQTFINSKLNKQHTQFTTKEINFDMPKFKKNKTKRKQHKFEIHKITIQFVCVTKHIKQINVKIQNIKKERTDIQHLEKHEITQITISKFTI